ncbi:MAG: DUF192 domain-containing protein [Syntrophothermaceae bacterium]
MRIVNLTRGGLIASHARLADSFWTRLRGWMGRLRVEADEALVIYPCRAVHTCFMFIAIDVLFINQNKKVVYIMEGLPPFRLSPLIKDACTVVELPADTVRRCGVRVGDRLEFTGGVFRNN